jgi:hypothetical protein
VVRTDKGEDVVVDAIVPAYGQRRRNYDLLTKYLLLSATYDAGTPQVPKKVDAGNVWLPVELEAVLEKYFPHIRKVDPEQLAV